MATKESRLGVDIPKKLHDELQQYIPHGMKKRIYEQISVQLLFAFRKHGRSKVIAAVLDNELTTEKLLDLEGDRGDDRE